MIPSRPSAQTPPAANINRRSENSGSTPAWASTIDATLDTWSTSLQFLPPAVSVLEAARLLHRVAQITLHVSVLDIHAVAMDPPSLSDPSQPSTGPRISPTSANTTKALARLQRWVHTGSTRSACRYALLLI